MHYACYHQDMLAPCWYEANLQSLKDRKAFIDAYLAVGDSGNHPKATV